MILAGVDGPVMAADEKLRTDGTCPIVSAQESTRTAAQ
jgi:hypothetical protein